MNPVQNKLIIEQVVSITISKASNTTNPLNKEGGENIAEFMQVIYDKLAELYNKGCD